MTRNDAQLFQELTDRLYREQGLDSDGYRYLLTHCDEEALACLQAKAQAVAQAHFGRRIFIRGLIEVSNFCRNDCYYCGIQRSNRQLCRYRLSPDVILASCREGYRLGFRTFVLQGGEDPYLTDERVEQLVADIRHAFPDAAITLSLGEKSTEAYERFFRAGANRYLLRHETHNADHYRQLHPAALSLDNRLRCLNDLKRIGYQVGTGIMVGSPGQTIDHLVEDLVFIQEFRPQMIGIGPFLPHHDTPFAQQPPGSLLQTLLLLSLFRLMHPAALIPSTTALATLSPDGREQGIRSGANVVMPNLSPPDHRAQYALYDHKASMGAEAAEGLALLEKRLNAIGYTIDYGRGDFLLPSTTNEHELPTYIG